MKSIGKHQVKEDLENATPKIVINQSSTVTITDDSINYHQH